MLAIFENEKAAADAIAASPLIIDLSGAQQPATQRHRPQPSSAPQPTEQPIADKPPSENTPSSENQPESAPSEESLAEGNKMFCTIFPSNHRHDVHAGENPYHRSFRVTTQSLEVQDLVHKYGIRGEIYGGVPQMAMADCFARRKQSRPYRFQKSIMDKNQSFGGNSPMTMWKIGQARREGKNADAQAMLDRAFERYERDMESIWKVPSKAGGTKEEEFETLSLDENSDDLDAQLDFLAGPSSEENGATKEV